MICGRTAIYDNAPQRRFRDAFTATAHFQVNEVSRELPACPARPAGRRVDAMTDIEVAPTVLA